MVFPGSQAPAWEAFIAEALFCWYRLSTPSLWKTARREAPLLTKSLTATRPEAYLGSIPLWLFVFYINNQEYSQKCPVCSFLFT